jgi:hypothetical protein
MPKRNATCAVIGAGDCIGAEINQPRSARTFELEIRPFGKKW